MKRCLILVVLFLGGRGPRNAPPTLPPDFLAVPTAYLAPSYPTAQAQAVSADQTSNGVVVRVEKAWQDGKEVVATCVIRCRNDFGLVFVERKPALW